PTLFRSTVDLLRLETRRAAQSILQRLVNLDGLNGEPVKGGSVNGLPADVRSIRAPAIGIRGRDYPEVIMPLNHTVRERHRAVSQSRIDHCQHRRVSVVHFVEMEQTAVLVSLAEQSPHVFAFRLHVPENLGCRCLRTKRDRIISETQCVRCLLRNRGLTSTSGTNHHNVFSREHIRDYVTKLPVSIALDWLRCAVGPHNHGAGRECDLTNYLAGDLLDLIPI